MAFIPFQNATSGSSNVTNIDTEYDLVVKKQKVIYYNSEDQK